MPDSNVIIPKTRPKPAPRAVAMNNISQPVEPAHHENNETANLTASDRMHCIKPGVQKKTFAKLRRGRYPIEAEMDLHGMIIEVAQKELVAFISRCGRKRMRTIKIIHGKGLSAVNGRAVLKNKVQDNLRGWFRIDFSR